MEHFFYELANDYSPDLTIPLAFMAGSLPSIMIGFVALAVFDISDGLSNKADGANKVSQPQNKKVTEHFNADGSLSHVTVGHMRFSSVDDARKYIEGK